MCLGKLLCEEKCLTTQSGLNQETASLRRLMCYILVKRNEDPRYKFSATIVRNLGILQNTAVSNFAIIAKMKGISLKTDTFDL